MTHSQLQGSRIILVLGCVISPLRQHPELRNLGQTLFGSPVQLVPAEALRPWGRLDLMSGLLWCQRRRPLMYNSYQRLLIGPTEFKTGNWSILHAVWQISFYFHYAISKKKNISISGVESTWTTPMGVPGQRQGSDTNGEQMQVILEDSASLERLPAFHPFHAVLHIHSIDPWCIHWNNEGDS